ncbi:MipA/OmpV family protein [Trinickia fusca]|uniref:MipA/OmpV family protein n=1 Tax=Trinickia fusca TaxID=2419777 RepID=A0A494XE77_9BURK|nr:MipA/OmpV family protein [Trinickia fusca]RKP48192.1 MipA/OmpV family protein [Trinickia fusca]
MHRLSINSKTMMNKRHAVIFGTILFISSGARAESGPVVNGPEKAGNGYALSVGVGGGYGPRYMGSKTYQFAPVILFDAKAPWGLFASSSRGIGYELALPFNFFASAALNYDAGRKARNTQFGQGSDALKGMGDIKGAVLASLTTGYRFGEWGSVDMSVDLPLTARERGITYHLMADATVLNALNDKIAVNAAAHFGSAKYNQTFFGVTPAQSAQSGFPAYMTGGGLYALGTGVEWTHTFSRHWSTTVAGQIMRYTGTASRSPIVKSRFNYQVQGAVNYTF